MEKINDHAGEKGHSSSRIPLTMLLVTQNRQWLLDTIIQYHAPHVEKIVISVASDQPWPDAPALSSWGNVFYRYEPHMSVLDRMAKLADDVETPFATYRADRRQVANHALKACCDFLQTHPGYASARGMDIHGESLAVESAAYIEPYGEIEDSLERTLSLVFGSQLFIYSVLTTKLMKINRELFSCCTRNIYLFEFPHHIAAGLAGKHKALPLVHGYLFSTNNSTPSKYDDYIESRVYYNDYHKWQSLVEEHVDFFVKKFGITSQNVRNIFSAFRIRYEILRSPDVLTMNTHDRDVIIQSVFSNYKGTPLENYIDHARKAIIYTNYQNNCKNFKFSLEDTRFINDWKKLEKHFRLLNPGVFLN